MIRPCEICGRELHYGQHKACLVAPEPGGLPCIVLRFRQRLRRYWRKYYAANFKTEGAPVAPTRW